MTDGTSSAMLAAAAPLASPFVLGAVLTVSGLLALSHYRALPRATVPPTPLAGEADGVWPRVSIIVPARNEEHNLPTLLRSLAALDYPHLEVLVVDDGSTDTTSAIAAAYAASSSGRLRVLRRDGPPPGWTGKNAACDQGARAATGDWLLFTDADTEHEPTSLRAAIATAREAHAQALSLFAGQRCQTFWERLLLPYAYQGYFVGVRPPKPGRPAAAPLANGQYFLIERAAYDAAGGHAAVAGSIIDDVALAGALQRAGYPTLVCRGESLVHVRMYRGLGPLVEGFTKNTFQFLRAQRLAGIGVALGVAAAVGLPGAVFSAARAHAWAAVGIGALAYAAQVALLAPWQHAFGVSRRYALLAPLAALTFTAIALSSVAHVVARRPVRWKGRGYAARGA